MATILAHLRIKPGSAARFEEIARQLYAVTHTEETGVQQYQYFRGEDENTYYTLLAFDDFNAFLAHQTSPHHEDAAPQLGEVMESIRLEWIDPLDGGSSLPPTRAQAVPEGASELTRTYAQRYAAKEAPWWDSLRAH